MQLTPETVQTLVTLWQSGGMPLLLVGLAWRYWNGSNARIKNIEALCNSIDTRLKALEVRAAVEDQFQERLRGMREMREEMRHQ